MPNYSLNSGTLRIRQLDGFGFSIEHSISSLRAVHILPFS
jgi:hypothetical protein